MRFIAAFLCILLAGICHGNTLSTKVSPKVISQYSVNYFDFSGTKDDKHGNYGFESIEVESHNLNVSYLVSTELSVSVMLGVLNNYVETKMFGSLYKDTSAGMMDTLVMPTLTKFSSSGWLVTYQAGLSLPTGAIDLKNKNVPTGDVNYAYNMQMGSGTVDPVLAIFAQKNYSGLIVNGYSRATFRLGENSQGYRLGNEYQLLTSAGYSLFKGYFMPQVRGFYRNRKAISGEDKTFGRSFLTEYYHHDQNNWDVSLVANFVAPVSDAIKVNLSLTAPVAQGVENFDDVVVETNSAMGASVTGTF